MITATISDTVAGDAAARRTFFYFWMAVAMAATAFIGFAPTFWLPMAQGIPERINVLAIHGVLFYCWTLFVIYQAWLVAAGNVARHREVGMIGVSLATAMTIFGVLAAINAAKRATALNFGAGGEAFMVVAIADLFLFVTFVISAIRNVHRAEWHKRLMLSATAVTLGAAIGRPFIVYIVMGGHPPPFIGTVGLAGFNAPPAPVNGVLAPQLAALLFIVVGMVRDWRVLGKVHPAYWWAGGFGLAVHVLKMPLSDTAMWHGFARSLISLAS
jgi:hypothetical protein